MVISGENGLDRSGSEVIDRALHLDAADDGGEKRLRVRRAFEDGSHQRAAQERWRVVALPDGFPQELPIGRKLRVSAALADRLLELSHDLEIGFVFAEVIEQFADGRLIKEANGKPGGIRRQAEEIEASGVRIVGEIAVSFVSLLQRLEERLDFCAQLLVLRFLDSVLAAPCDSGEDVFEDCFLVGPENASGVANAEPVFRGLRAAQKRI